MNDKETIISKLSHMNKTDLLEIKSACDFNLEKITGKRTNSDEELFYNCLRKILAQYGVTGVARYSVFRGTSSYRFLKSNFPIVEEFTRHHISHLGHRQKVKLFNLYARILISRIQAERSELTIQRCCIYLYKLPGLVDAAFPGYTESGFLEFLIREGDNLGNESMEEEE